MIQEDVQPARSNRQERRRRATREKLVSTAIRVFNDKGIDNTTVNDITEGADVAYGTFYNYFTSIEDLAPQVINMKIRQHIEEVREMQRGVDDIALIVAISVRELAKKVVSDETMRWLSERPVIMVEELTRCLVDDAEAHNRVGVNTGRFDLAASQSRLHTFCIWGITGLLQDALRNPEAADEITDDMTRIYLRILGVPKDSVEEVLARRPRRD